jgi:hypothetical protein
VISTLYDKLTKACNDSGSRCTLPVSVHIPLRRPDPTELLHPILILGACRHSSNASEPVNIEAALIQVEISRVTMCVSHCRNQLRLCEDFDSPAYSALGCDPVVNVYHPTLADSANLLLLPDEADHHADHTCRDGFRGSFKELR